MGAVCFSSYPGIATLLCYRWLVSVISGKCICKQKIYMLFTGCEVRIGKNCARGLKPANNVFIFSAFFSENEHGKLVCKKSFYVLYVALSQLKLTYN